jgi:hypothetical protein
METVTRKDLPCANPQLVDEYVAIEEILQGQSSDSSLCGRCNGRLCEHILNAKRQDESYKVLVQHFRDGGEVNQPLNWDRWGDGGYQSNGHHRLAAALDAGFTHVPVNHEEWGDDYDWSNVEPERYGFQMNRWDDGVEEIAGS